MAPEPTQEPLKETLTAPNIVMDLRMGNDSDSDDEDITMAGYMPLSQVPMDSDPMLEEVEDEDSVPTDIIGTPINLPAEGPSETIQVWSSSCTRSNIDLDANKIDQVKSAMASFTLPTTAIPEWANSISEEQWKEQLIVRIQEMQKRSK